MIIHDSGIKEIDLQHYDFAQLINRLESELDNIKDAKKYVSLNARRNKT